ncbi:MAG TPA: Wall-associated protein precursor, partial [Hyalangium sp.]|nr:Wall-associated protein precursor [Hyalangium sp.]
DERYVAKAKDKESHCGYQKWHRDVDLEIIKWLRNEGRATAEEFMAKLREIYNRKDMLERFPNGFGPAP